MHIENFNRLYKKVWTIDLKACNDVQLRALFAVYKKVHFLVSTMLWLEAEYGSRLEIGKILKEIAKELTVRMRVLPLEAQVDSLDVLLELFPLILNGKEENRTLEKADILLRGTAFDQENGFEVSLCRLACDCYYLIQDEELKERIEKILCHWEREQSGSGAWEGISPLLAINRLFTLDAYNTVTLDATYHECFRKGSEAYLRPVLFPEQGTCCSEEQILTYCNMALLQLNETTVEENPLVNRIEKVLEEYLGPYIFSGKSICLETPLICISVLTACLQRHLDWECWKKAL